MPEDKDTVDNNVNIKDVEVPPVVQCKLKKLSNFGQPPALAAGRTQRQTRDAQALMGDGKLMCELAGQRQDGAMCPSDHDPLMADLEVTVMTQLNMKQGIKAFGNDSVKQWRKNSSSSMTG